MKLWLGLGVLLSVVPSLAHGQRIAARGARTCVVRASSAVHCFGGRFGPPAERARGASAVTMGAAFACVLREDRSVQCFRDQGPAAAVPGLSDIREIVASAEQLCARDGEGAVRCGAVGEQPAALQPVPGLTHVQQLVAGTAHFCARMPDDSVRCWGEASANQLGEGRTDRRARPVSARQLGRAVELAAGDEFTCARSRTNTVSCVGYRFDAEGRESPRVRAAWTPRLLTGADRLFAGASMLCALVRRRGVTCSGFNAVVSTGLGESSVRFADGALGPGDSEEVAVGDRGVCLLRAGGVVSCVGDDAAGALGGAGGARVVGPTRINGLEGVTRLSSAGNHTCAITSNGEVKCWGFDDPQDLFATSGERPGSLGLRPVPTALPAVRGATDLALSGGTTVVRGADGGLWIWGAGPFEPLGAVDGAGVDRVVRVAPAPHRVQYALGIQHLCARTAAGGVECVGAGQHGQWGNGEAPAVTEGGGWFRRTWAPVRGLAAVAHLAAAWNTNCARKTDGTLWCWGQNASRLMGAADAGGTVSAPRQLALREPVGSGSSWVMAGLNARVFGCVGQWCGGANDQWQTGSAGPREREELVFVPLNNRRISAMAAGTSHACAADDDGGVWCWGANDHGQLGSSGPTSLPRAVPSVRAVVELAAGRRHTCARTREGAVWCWGGTADGSVGDGNCAIVRAPRDVSFPR